MVAATYHGPVYDFATRAFEDFRENSLTPALPQIGDPTNQVYLFCHLMPDGLYGRRLMVVSEPGEDLVRVYVEASYDLFEGDTHYHVRRIGDMPRNRAAQDLPGLLQTAFTELMAWNSSHQSIWEEIS